MREKRTAARGRGLSGFLMAAGAGAFLSLALCFSTIAAPTFPEGTRKASIEDAAGLLDEEEEQQLLERAAALSEETGFEIRLYTTDDAGGEDTQTIAENYFESMTSDGPDEASGGCYVIDMDSRNYYLATYGEMLYYITDSRLDVLLDDAYDSISSQDYAGTFESMLEDTARFWRKGIADGTRIYNEDTGEWTVYEAPKQITGAELVLSLIIGGIVFAVVFFTVTVRYGMKGAGSDGFSARDNVAVRLRRNEDRLVNHFVTRRQIPRNDDHGSGGGGTTTTHTTGGGYSAGGGGRHF